MSIRKLASVLLLIPILTLGSSFIVVGTQDLEDTPNSLFNKTLMRWGSRSQPPLITSNSEGDIIVVGATVNADLQMVDSWQKTSKGGLETFILKLNAMGELVWSTYFGGSKSDYVKALETGSDGSIVIAGHTSSADLILGTGQRLTTADLFDFDEDLFVSRIEKNGTISSTAVFGGNLSEIIMSVTIDQDLNAVVFGQSYSPDFPSGQNSTLGAGFFLTKVGRDGSILEISKPSAFDDMYLFSSAYLNDHELVTVGSANFEEVLLTVIHINGTSLWSNSVNHGSDSLNVDSVFIDDGQRIVIVGSIYNESSQTAYNDYEGSYFYPDADEFIECFSSNGTRLWRNAIAGSSEDYGNFVIAGPSGEILLFGETYSSDFPNSWSNLSVYHGEGDISIGFHGPDGF
ncbi:MAG TPA: hypothetical protein VJ044_16575, partial [Candidatus Hodarchaeales archaeon]|nr:hypothetical protein [Candidatus Hodarchaeales archaeon]